MYKKAFDEYVSHYDIKNKDIKLKYDHSYRVMKLSEKYAKLLGFSKEDIKLASLIGLLHDIGRFEQLKVYNTYNDKNSIDHADYGVKVLFEDGLIKKFWKKEEDYELIKFAIKNHNKLNIEKTTDERLLKHAKLIRDTDKVDILFLEGKLDIQKLRTDNTDISNKIIDLIKENKSIDYKYVKSSNDHLALFFSFAFDINNDIVLDEFKKNVEDYYETIDVNNKLNEIYNETIKYIDERIDNYARY